MLTMVSAAAYSHTAENEQIQLSKFTEGEKEWNERINANKVDVQLMPPVLADEA